MEIVLAPHSDTPRQAVSAIRVRAGRSGAGLTLAYMLEGDPTQVRLPDPAAGVRTDGLWRTTCLEAFVAPASMTGYAELNFSPATHWAAYRFDGYRAGMAALDMRAPQIAVARHDGAFELTATADLSALPAGPWRLALAAVIEEVDGRIGYWALRHPPGKPDFHHPDCFAAELR